jgi:hypothetical protein
MMGNTSKVQDAEAQVLAALGETIDRMVFLATA